MAERKPGYELARRRLGDALRRHREKANIRIDAAASELECSAAKISRLENGLGPAKLWEVRVLLDLYSVDDRRLRARMEQWAKDSKELGWWEEEAADLISEIRFEDPNLYLAAETEASQTRSYCTPVLPALLQTAEYSDFHTRALHPNWPEVQVERLKELRLKRQEAVLRDSDPLRFHAVLDEGAVRRVVGGHDTHVNQLKWLLDVINRFAIEKRDNLVVRILPFSAGVPSRALNAFTIFDPRQPDVDRSMAYQDDNFGGTWANGENLDLLNDIYAELTASALDPEHSRQFLQEVIAEL